MLFSRANQELISVKLLYFFLSGKISLELRAFTSSS